MSKIENLRIRHRLLIPAALFLAGFVAFAAVALHTQGEIAVNGPIYSRIIDGKDLVADVLPPPLFLLEAFCLLFQPG